MRVVYAAMLAFACASSATAQSGFAAPILEAELRPPGVGSTIRSAFGTEIVQDGDYAAVTGAYGGRSYAGTNGTVHLLHRNGDAWELQQSLAPIDGPETRFGVGIALKGNLLFVGAPGPYGEFVTHDGTVFVYAFDGTEWRETDRIESPIPFPPNSFGSFGESLSFDGTHLVVGAPGDSTGAAYVFERRNGVWTRTATLTPSEAEMGGFGSSVKVSGSYAVIEGRGTSRLRAITFERAGETWTETGDLSLAIGGYLWHNFQIDINGDRLALASEVGYQASNTGAVYVFDRVDSAWALTTTLERGTPWFGTSIDLDGDSLLVGSQGYNRAFLYTFDGVVWSLKTVLKAADDRLAYGFGEAVALDGMRALIGASNAQVEGSRTGAVIGFVATADSAWVQTSVATQGPNRDGVLFGQSIALSGNRAAVGAPVSQYAYSSWGSAYVFTVENGVPTVETRLVLPYKYSFGTAIAMGTDQLVISAPTEGGAGYVFVYSGAGTTWTPTQTLSGSSGFGTSLSLNGDRLLIGAPGNAARPGRAVLYERRGATWALAAEFSPSIPENGTSFGTSVALDGARVLVGAPNEATGGGLGLVAVFESEGATWTRVATLTSGASGPSGVFGTSVAASGGRALVGAPSVSGGPGDNGGTATVFDGVAWTPVATLGERRPNNTAGARVALDGGRALVSDPLVGAFSGRAALYAFDGLQWVQTADLPSPHPAAGERFGSGIALDGRRFAIGGPTSPEDATSPGFGSVYLFRDAVTVADEAEPPADGPRLGRPSPNPASSSARLVLTLLQPERVTATVYDALGRSVQTLLSDALARGEVPLTVDARRLAPGLYVVRAAGETFVESARLVVVR